MTGQAASDSATRERLAAAGRLIVALDMPSASQAFGVVEALQGEARIFKIGVELIYSDGLVLARALADAGFQIFLDAKLLDIPNTVEGAAASAARAGASFLTVHGVDSKTLGAAVRGRAGSAMKLLAVTVLTSLEESDLAGQGLSISLPELVMKRAQLAQEAGFDGVVASPQEAAAIRSRFGNDFLIVTPGIRPAGAVSGDQQRTATPAGAIAAGADYLVVGRPITQAGNPRQAIAAIVDEIAAATPRSS